MSKQKLWAGYILSGLAILFLLMDSIIKLLQLDVAVETTLELGYLASVVPILGGILLLCTIIYIIPQTSVLGAILLTAYLGGAIATHMRIGNPLFSHVLFPVYLGLMLWGGLYLRDTGLSQIIPLLKTSSTSNS